MRRITDNWTAQDILIGHVVGSAEYLFTTIKPEMADTWRSKYGGNQSGPPPESKTSKRKAAKAKAASSTGLTEAPEGIEKTKEMCSLETSIKDQGVLVRELKSENGDAGAIKEAVERLLLLKKDLGELFAKARGGAVSSSWCI